MNKFIQNLTASNAEIKESRAKRLASQAELAQTQLVSNLKSELLSKESQLENLMDMAPENSYDLKFVDGKFDAVRWAELVQELQVSIELLRQKLDIAQETYRSWFGKLENAASDE